MAKRTLILELRVDTLGCLADNSESTSECTLDNAGFTCDEYCDLIDSLYMALNMEQSWHSYDNLLKDASVALREYVTGQIEYYLTEGWSDVPVMQKLNKV